MPNDRFQTTRRTWIEEQMDRGREGMLAVNHYLMDTYAFPLKVYYLGTNSRWLGEPDDVIGGFFENRLKRDDFVPKWRRSGMKLRRWLMNALSYYLKELRRQRRSRERPTEAVEEAVTFSGNPEAVVDRAAALVFVRKAMQQTEAHCAAKGLEEHWKVFQRHVVDGAPFRDLAEEFGVSPGRAAVMSRTASRRFRQSLQDLLREDGVEEDEMDDEIAALIEALGS